jgi:hypothetical protein
MHLLSDPPGEKVPGVHRVQRLPPGLAGVISPHPGKHTVHCCLSLDMGYSVVDPVGQAVQVKSPPTAPAEYEPRSQGTA